MSEKQAYAKKKMQAAIKSTIRRIVKKHGGRNTPAMRAELVTVLAQAFKVGGGDDYSVAVTEGENGMVNVKLSLRPIAPVAPPPREPIKSTGDPILDLQAICAAGSASEEELGRQYKELGWGVPFPEVLSMAEGVYIERGDDGLYRSRAGSAGVIVQKVLSGGDR